MTIGINEFCTTQHLYDHRTENGHFRMKPQKISDVLTRRRRENNIERKQWSHLQIAFI